MLKNRTNLRFLVNEREMEKKRFFGDKPPYRHQHTSYQEEENFVAHLTK